MIGERNGDSIFLLLVTPINCKQGDNFVMQLSHMLDMHPILAAPAEPKVPVFTPEENWDDCTSRFLTVNSIEDWKAAVKTRGQQSGQSVTHYAHDKAKIHHLCPRQ
jgi:hypothetical protein